MALRISVPTEERNPESQAHAYAYCWILQIPCQRRDMQQITLITIC